MTKQHGLRVAGAAVLVCAGALVLRSHGLPLLPSILVMGLLGQTAWAMLQRCTKTWPQAKQAWLRSTIRGVRWLRHFYRATPGIAFMAPASWFLLSSTILVALITYSGPVYRVGALAWGFLLALLGAAECFQRTRRLMRFAWAGTAGRVVLLGLGGLIYVIAHALANHLAYAINLLDPKFFPNFVALASVVLTPLLYVYGFAVLIAGWALVELLILSVLYGLSQASRLLAVGLGRMRSHDAAVYRLVYGRRPTIGYQRDMFDDGLVFVQRTGSMVIFVIGVLLGLGLLSRGEEAHMQWLSRQALVAIEYRPAGLCGTHPGDSYLPLEQDRVSVAHRRGQDLAFEVIHCAEVPRSDALASTQVLGGEIVAHP